jgi:hypothetical protein
MARPLAHSAPSESVKIDPDTLAMVREIATAHGWSVSAALRALIDWGARELLHPLAPGQTAVVAGHCAAYEFRAGISHPSEADKFERIK